MEKIFIDFSKCKTEQELHRELKTKLEFPDYYGENIDALWDCLTDIFDPMEITVKSPCVSSLSYEFKWIREVLQDYVKKYSFSQVIFLDESE